MFKKVLSVVLVMLMIIGVVPSSVFAAETAHYDLPIGGSISITSTLGSNSSNRAKNHAWTLEPAGIAEVTKDTSNGQKATVKGIEGKTGTVTVTHKYDYNQTHNSETFSITFIDAGGGNTVPYEVYQDGNIKITGPGTTGTWSVENADASILEVLAEITKTENNTAVISGKGKEGTVVVSYKYKLSDGSSHTQKYTIHFGPAVDKTVHWTEEGRTAEIMIQSVQTKEAAGKTPKVLFLGSLCGSHDLKATTITTSINTLATVADVDYYLGGRLQGDLSYPSNVPMHDTLLKGSTLSSEAIKIIALTTGAHVSHYYFADVINSKVDDGTLDDYDMIIMEFDGLRMSYQGGSGNNNDSYSKDTIAKAVGVSSYTVLENSLAKAGTALLDFYAQGKVAWMVPELNAGTSEGALYMYNDKAIIGSNTNRNETTYDAMALIAPEDWLVIDGNTYKKDTSKVQYFRSTFASGKNFFTEYCPTYVARCSERYSEDNTEGMWTVYGNSEEVKSLIKEKSEEIIRFQEVNIQDVVADGFKIVSVKGQYLDEKTDTPEWKDIDPESGNFEYKYDENNSNKIIADFKLGNLKCEKTRLLITIETTEEIIYEGSEGEKVVATNVGSVIVVYDEDPNTEETDDPPVLPQSGVDIQKYSDPAKGTVVYVGDAINYYFKVVNKGDTDITSFKVTDSNIGFEKTFTKTIAPGKTLVLVDSNYSYTALDGETVEKTTIAKHTVTADDLAAGSVDNKAFVEATTKDGKIYDEGDSSNPVKVKISVKKVWDDGDDQDGLRPESVVIQLYKKVGDGEETLVSDAELTLDDTNDWTDAFTGLEPTEDSLPIVYSVKEKETTKGYECTPSGNATDGYVFTNKHTPETVSIDVTKKWVDGGDSDDLRPESIGVQLYITGADGKDEEVSGKTLTLDADNSWTDSFDDLPKYDDGDLIAYTVKEVASSASDDYDSSESGSIADGFVITNTQKKTFTVTKVWDDEGYEDFRPDGDVNFALYKKVNDVESKVGDYSLEESSSYSKEFELPSYEIVSDTAYPIVYSVKEVVDSKAVEEGGVSYQGYTVSYSEDTAGLVITNTIQKEETIDSVEFTLKKEDLNGVEGTGLANAVYTLTKKDAISGVDYTTGSQGADLGKVLASISEAGTYTLQEKSAPTGYQVSDDVFTIVVVEDSTHASIKYDSDKGKYVKTTPLVIESVKVGDKVYDGYTEDLFTVKDPAETVDVSVEKVWVDGDDRDDIRPDGVDIQLYQKIGDGTETEVSGKLQTLSESANNWKYSFTGLPKYIDGTEIQYSVKEVTTTVITGVDKAGEYAYEVTGSQADGYVVTNTHTPGVATITFRKVWQDAGFEDAQRSDVKFAVYKTYKNDSGQSVTEKCTTVTLTKEDKDVWSATVNDLPKYEKGEPITYSIIELDTDGTTEIPATSDENDKYGDNYFVSYETSDDGLTLTAVNTEFVRFDVKKVWADDLKGNNSPVTIHLSAENDDTVDEDLVLESSNDFTGSFEELPKYTSDGEEIEYVLEESTQLSGYKSEQTTAADGTIVFTNTAVFSISGEKTWDDSELSGKEGYSRPDSITVRLDWTYDGDDEFKEITVSEDPTDKSWKYKFEDLLVYDTDGEEIEYTLSEKAAGYTAQDGTNEWDIKNVPVTEEKLNPVDLTIKKTDAGTTSGAGINGAKFTVTTTDAEKNVFYVNANGELQASKYEFETANDGTVAVTLKAEGTYTVIETAAPSGYTISNEAAAGYEVTVSKGNITKVNKVTGTTDESVVWQKEFNLALDDDSAKGLTVSDPSEKASVKVKKSWDDAENQDNLRPQNVVITLQKLVDKKAEDVEGVDPLTLSGAKWEGSFTDLPAYIDGVKVDYVVAEKNVPSGYEFTGITGDAENGYTVTNKHVPEVITVSGSKSWADSEYTDAPGYERPEIKVKLVGKVDGKVVDALSKESETLAAPDYEYEFKNVPKFYQGKEVTYSVEEVEVPDGYESSVESGTYNLINTPLDKEDEYEPVSLSILKVDDGSSQGFGGAKFTVSVPNPDKDSEVKILYLQKKGDLGESAYEFPVASDGTLELTFPVDGVYTIEETTVPEGYETIDLPVYEVNVEKTLTGVEWDSKEEKWIWSYDLSLRVSAAGGNADDVDYNKDSNKLTIHNIPTLTNVVIRKEWNDEDNKLKLRPEYIEAALYQTVNGETSRMCTFTISEGDEWVVPFEELYAYRNGYEIEYSVVELNEDEEELKIKDNYNEDYTLEEYGEDEDGLYITNKVIKKPDDEPYTGMPEEYALFRTMLLISTAGIASVPSLNNAERKKKDTE